MKFCPIRKNPADRARFVDEFGRKMGLVTLAQRQVLQLACTPPCLRELADHSGRGKKSCTRIAQLRGRPGYKVRKKK